MDTDKRDKLDSLIDSALREEPQRSVPFAFHRGVQERLQIAALLDRERKRFRTCWAFAGAVAGMLLASVPMVWFGAGIPDLVGRAVPGALGSYDHFVLVLANGWPSMALVSVVLIAVLGAAYYAFARGLSRRRSSVGRA